MRHGDCRFGIGKIIRLSDLDPDTTEATAMYDPHRMTLVAYEAMDFCNPLSVDTLERALRWANLKPGLRTLDLGCGNAAMSAFLAERYGLQVDALERSPAVAAIARTRTAGRGAPGSVTIHEADSKDFLKAAEPYDLLVCAGASAVAAESADPHAVLAALKPHVKPGGLILWADPFWKRDPDPDFVALLGGYAAYLSHAENISAGEAAGLSIRYAAASPDHEWDDYIFGINSAALAWVDAHPDDPQSEDVAQRAALHRMAYLRWSRDTVGFGLYLFKV
jgi:SAM-dependent methyltransferase